MQNPKTAEPVPVPLLKAPSVPEGHCPGRGSWPAPPGGKQQHLALVPEESSDRAARLLDPGSPLPVRSAHRPRGTNDKCMVGGQTGTRAAQGGLFLWSLEQGGSDKLQGNQGITASPAPSLDLLVLAIKMACNILGVDVPWGTVACRRAFGQTDLGAHEILTSDNAGDHMGVGKDAECSRRKLQVLSNHHRTLDAGD